MQETDSDNGQILTESRRAYSIAQKVFCCKCFYSCQDVTIVTSHIRKQTLQKMIRNYVIDEHEITMYDPIKLMILIYLCEDTEIPKRHLWKCRVNPSSSVDTYRSDLEFYIPQLCNYIVFHSDLNPTYLLEGLQKSSQMSFYFGHLYYFYMISQEKIIGQKEIQTLRKVSQYKTQFLQNICKLYEGHSLTSVELFGNYKTNVYPSQPQIGLFIKNFGTKEEDALSSQREIQAKDITLPKYTSIFSTQPEIFSFKSTINFFEDLFTISEDLKSAGENKKMALKKALMIINEKLPASVYIPFSKKMARLSNVLNIVASECRVFSTKERAPYYICVEVFNPVETLEEDDQDRFWDKVETPFTFTQVFRSESHISTRKSSLDRPQRNTMKTNRTRRDSNFDQEKYQNPYSESIQTEIMSQRETRYLNNELLNFSNQMETQPRLRLNQNTSKKNVEMKELVSTNKKVANFLNQIFGESQEDFKERIRGKSIFGHLQTWDLVHLIVKTNDNLKQEQFALQLITQFDYIFKLEKLPLNMTPYEVLSMGPDYGILEMVKDAITFDFLKKKLRTEFPKPMTLKQFFEIYFMDNLAKAKQNFMRSLVAYSLVMYFLQAKDRHNGNIMLHKSGKMFHIDFGFFLSNMPGKGMQLEKACPFKLLSQQIQVLDGPESYYFKKFREYFFLGFKAARKHQNKILILVKMMYSASGMSMPCFEKGEAAIQEIQDRFNPPHVTNDAQLNLHCQKLIDSSLDNWAAKWYDRWQYWAQGIFY